MAELENRRVRMTKGLLRKSLIELMHNLPISKITIKALCENADVNRSTFYLYYADPRALLDEIENELLLRAQEHLEKIDTNPGSIPYLEALLCYISGNADIFTTLLCRQENADFQSKFVEESFRNLKLNLNLGSAGNLRDYLYNYMTMGSLAMIRQWIGSGFEPPCRDMAELMFTISNRAAAPFIH